MTSLAIALNGADALIDQVQALTTDGRYVPRFFDMLFGLRTALGDARDRFAGAQDAQGADLPLFATVQDRCEQATTIGTMLIPDDAAMARYAEAVRRAIGALGAAQGATLRPGLRGALRLRRPTMAALRPGRSPDPAPEPYYASLVKLFPVEAVTLYPLAIGIAAGNVGVRLILIGVIMLFVVALRWFATQEESGGDADVPAILVAVISFALYAAALGGFGDLPGGRGQTSQLLAFLTIMWVALVPFALRRARRP